MLGQLVRGRSRTGLVADVGSDGHRGAAVLGVTQREPAEHRHVAHRAGDQLLAVVDHAAEGFGRCGELADLWHHQRQLAPGDGGAAAGERLVQVLGQFDETVVDVDVRVGAVAHDDVARLDHRRRQVGVEVEHRPERHVSTHLRTHCGQERAVGVAVVCAGTGAVPEYCQCVERASGVKCRCHLGDDGAKGVPVERPAGTELPYRQLHDLHVAQLAQARKQRPGLPCGGQAAGGRGDLQPVAEGDSGGERVCLMGEAGDADPRRCGHAATSSGMPARTCSSVWSMSSAVIAVESSIIPCGMICTPWLSKYRCSA